MLCRGASPHPSHHSDDLYRCSGERRVYDVCVFMGRGKGGGGMFMCVCLGGGGGEGGSMCVR